MRIFSILLAFALLSGCVSHEKDPKKLFVGASEFSITPEPGAYIAGGKNNRIIKGVHDSLFVKALVLSDDSVSIAFLSFDCIGLLYPTLQEIRKEAALRIPDKDLNPSNIVMSSTHTHSGPDVVGIWGPDPLTSGVDSIYMKNLVNTSVKAILAALKKRQPAIIKYAVTEHGEDWVFNISDSANLDRSLSILQFENTEGKSIATLTNFACHPTIMDGATDLVSGDYVGAMYNYLDQKFGGVNLFIQGAIGGWVQPEYEKKRFDNAKNRGEELGRAVEVALREPKIMNSSKLSYRALDIKLPVSNEGFRQLSAAGVIERDIVDSVVTELAWFTIGDAQFVTHPGETTPTHSFETKKLMQNHGPKFVIGLGMDALGYILTPDFYDQDAKLKHTGYLTYMSIDKNAGTIMMEGIRKLTAESTENMNASLDKL